MEGKGETRLIRPKSAIGCSEILAKTRNWSWSKRDFSYFFLENYWPGWILRTVHCSLLQIICHNRLVVCVLYGLSAWPCDRKAPGLRLAIVTTCYSECVRWIGCVGPTPWIKWVPNLNLWNQREFWQWWKKICVSEEEKVPLCQYRVETRSYN